ncbi:MAG: Integral membrane sensor signal transduction histidine kinase [Veillonella dispar DORA_11]|uniref:histidine kinase n=1 Tax=Veillonella dispar DORA_11 TaxID=1403949 RepID=W1UXC5_9FIRM|nr:MAG: Integral membrane sensor signal transduction histidine kinase [Veillonella dispar DORA_11]
MEKSKLHLTILFSFLVFLILFLTMVCLIFIIVFLSKYNLIHVSYDYIGLIWFSSASIFIGTTFSHFIGKKAIRFITNISDATKKVAKGYFNVKVDEDIKVKELNQMARNFNLMIHELASMEMFRNDFINNVSHEFKTPLAAVKGYATLLQSKNISEEKRQAYVSKIIYNTSRLSELTENILLISRLENQNISISKSEFSLDEQIRQIILLFEQDWTNRNINLDIDLDKVNYNGNEELLAQVWQNIIGNAMKFTPDNGLIKISMKKSNDNITVSVVDNGIGMDKDTQSRIFEKFYQGDKSHALKGNGLGLALVKQIIDFHNGNISVSSQEGKGSTFKIDLPIN